MVELEYVRKRRRRRLVAIISAVASIGIAVLILVSFLGHYVGTFTVSLDTGKVKLALSEESSFEHSTSHLVVDKLSGFTTTSFKSIDERKEQVDNENYDSNIGADLTPAGNVARYEFYKYTFFIKNVGSETASYELAVHITNNESYALDQILRIMMYHNDASKTDEHNFTVFARKSETQNFDEETGTYTSKEYTSITPKEHAYGEEYPTPRFAEEFPSSGVAAKLPVEPNFIKNKMMRYTIVWWLEGNDPQCVGEPPEDSNLKLGVKINAYENK